MNLDEIKKIYFSTFFLINFSSVKNDIVADNFLKFLKALETNDLEDILSKYNAFIFNLNLKKYDDFSLYLKNLILKLKICLNENELLENELNIISSLLKIGFVDVVEILKTKFKDFDEIFDKMPKYKNSAFDLKINDLNCVSYSANEDTFNKYRAFVFDKNFEIRPVENREKISFADLKGYEEQKRILYENTKALLNGLKVNNILLYGDAGCGKSTSVRALLNEFSEIKIVQIFKDNLINLDKLYSKLAELPHKFIIFADDISFDETDGIFSTMKAVLEGSLIQCPKNVAIYATSNRKHLVKESFSARKGDEIHLSDTINEINSLSERFGINLLFLRPSNEEFNKIVLELAKDNQIEINEEDIIKKAQRLAIIKGAKSPRVARQLIDNLIANIDI